MCLYEFQNGDSLVNCDSGRILLLRFAGERRVLSSSPLNGGIQEHLQAVFNQSGKEPDGQYRMYADTYEQHLEIVAKEHLGIDSKFCSGMSTAASMENVSIKTEDADGVAVTAITTAGIDRNGVRAGDPASYSERPGTVNIMLTIDADVPADAMIKAVITCTEAKTAAIQELLAPSCYSSGIATGSGTDSVILISNRESKRSLTDTGTHSKLGECIARATKESVKEAISLQTGVNAKKQHDIRCRMGRFGVTEKAVLQYCGQRYGTAETKQRKDKLERLCQDEILVTYTSLYAHLLDQLEWGLLRSREVMETACRLLRQMQFPLEENPQAEMTEVQTKEHLVRLYLSGLAERIVE